MKDLILIGGGGHCKSIIDTIIGRKDFNIIGILDKPDKVGTSLYNVMVIGTDYLLKDLFEKGIQYAVVSLGSIGNPQNRIRLYNWAKEIGYNFPVIIDKTAIVSKSAYIGEGTFVSKGVIINAEAEIGKHCIINTGSIIEHDCKINDFVHIAPGSTLSGGVTVDNCSHVGTNTTVIQNIVIGSNTIVGAGSVVVKDIKSNSIAYGNPCREVDSVG